MEESMKVLVTFMKSCDKLYKNPLAPDWFKIYWIKFSGCFALKKTIILQTQVPCVTYNAFNTLTAKLSRDSNVFAEKQQKYEVEKKKAAANTENDAQVSAQVHGDTQCSAQKQPAAQACAKPSAQV
jgi:hypothetical protein